jgi:predicted Zn-dependent peptidase
MLVKRFSNGIEFAAEPVPSSSLAAIAIRFGAGSRYETPQSSGVAHFAEHMLFKGTAGRSSFDIASAFDRMGGYANAYTDKECIVVYCVVPAGGAADALDVMLDMTFNSCFGADEIEIEREVILNEIISSRDDAEEEGLDRTAEAVWGKNPIAQSTAGQEDSVSRLTRGAIRGWYQKHIARAPFTVFAAGNIDAPAFARALSRVTPRTPAAKALKKPAWNPGLHVIDSPFMQEQFFVMFPFSLPVSEKRFYALAVFNALAGDTMSSRLFRRLREQSGLCYTVFSYNVYFADCGFWCAYASSSKKNLASVAQGIAEELAALKNVGEEEIVTAQEHLCGEELISSEDMEYRMKRLMRNRAMGFPLRGTDETLALVRGIGKKDVEREMALLFAGARADVVYGPKLAAASRGKLAKILGEYTTSTVL